MFDSKPLHAELKQRGSAVRQHIRAAAPIHTWPVVHLLLSREIGANKTYQRDLVCVE